MRTEERERLKPARHPSAHDADCTGESWQVQARIINRGPLLAYCRNCTAVWVIKPPTVPRSKTTG